ncbi:plant cysteine oxidase 2-like [Diospyros lotus]|uniref:plant cysteine oxidase 2-like n=1 Tax=Diospyros lotus TaxID=55363 RepID=UPI00225993BE|nr:plant cysteine oxidase 2-like [Diospyros lotus]
MTRRMRIEEQAAGRKGKERGELSSNTSSSKRSRHPPRKIRPIQRLYEVCKEVFASGGPGIVPPDADVERIKAVLDGMTGTNVGLNPDMPVFSKTLNQRAIITYLQVYECDKFSIVLFCLPPTAVIPLHNHPGMTVFSKLLFGSMRIKSYDWEVDVSSEVQPSSGARLAKVKVDSDFTAPCNTSILYPADGGNLHCFTALTSCAVLDVLGPPYSNPDGRDCTYYYDFPFSKFPADGVAVPEEGKEQYAWLKEREMKAADLPVVTNQYIGPKPKIKTANK